MDFIDCIVYISCGQIVWTIKSSNIPEMRPIFPYQLAGVGEGCRRSGWASTCSQGRSQKHSCSILKASCRMEWDKSAMVPQYRSDYLHQYEGIECVDIGFWGVTRDMRFISACQADTCCRLMLQKTMLSGSAFLWWPTLPLCTCTMARQGNILGCQTNHRYVCCMHVLPWLYTPKLSSW